MLLRKETYDALMRADGVGGPIELSRDELWADALEAFRDYLGRPLTEGEEIELTQLVEQFDFTKHTRLSKRDIESVPCPWCKRPAGASCVDPRGKEMNYHEHRRKAAFRLFRGK